MSHDSKLLWKYRRWSHLKVVRWPAPHLILFCVANTLGGTRPRSGVPKHATRRFTMMARTLVFGELSLAGRAGIAGTADGTST